jgi:hypothetical protein
MAIPIAPLWGTAALFTVTKEMLEIPSRMMVRLLITALHFHCRIPL